MTSVGRLAQLWLERFLDMEEATRSSRVSPTKRKGVARQPRTHPLIFNAATSNA